MSEEFEPIVRNHSPELDAILGKPFKTYDKGFVRVVDYMGNEASIVQAARVSYGKGTKKTSEDVGLIRYLLRHRHSTPFEMVHLKLHVKVPMDTWRQWIRHRTACLSGDTTLQFDLPGGIKRRGNQAYNLTLSAIFEKFKPTQNVTRPDKQRNPYHKRDRVQGMKLRCVNEETLEVSHTNIVDIWETGIKPVYKVTLDGGHQAKMSSDHLCFTEIGWKKLNELVDLSLVDKPSKISDVRMIAIGPGIETGVKVSFNDIDQPNENWTKIKGWEGWYEVSDQGRVRRVVGGKGSRSFGRCKKLTLAVGNHAVVSLNKPGYQETRLIHDLVLSSFVSDKPTLKECCHNDGNGLNNRLDNLRWDTAKSNAGDRIRNNALTFLKANKRKIVSVEYVGKEMTYDIEVAGPWHNFSVDGMIVHNSVNEYSTRYSEAIDDMAVTLPGEWRFQSTTNKQGSSGFLPEHCDCRGTGNLGPTPTPYEPGIACPKCDGTGLDGATLSERERQFHETAKTIYKDRLKAGVAREQARKDLPLSNYTEAYWRCDLHNLLNGFLSLRLDRHAQKEIRDCAAPIHQIVKIWVPNVYQAFEDYDHRRSALLLTRLDAEVIAALNVSTSDAIKVAKEFRWLDLRDDGTLKDIRERVEFEVKAKRLGLTIPWSKKVD